MTKGVGVGVSPGHAPASGGIRKPTDASQFNGPVYNQPRYAEWGGLGSASKTDTSVNNAASGKFRMPAISKPNGGRG